MCIRMTLRAYLWVQAFIFVEDAPFSPPGMPHLHWDAADAAKEKIVCADHWYDGIPLVRKSYRSWLAWDGTEKKAQVGNKNATAARENGIRNIQYKAANYMGGRPVVVGETGIPLDMEDGKAFKTGDFRMQDEAMDGVLGALEVTIPAPCFVQARPKVRSKGPKGRSVRAVVWDHPVCARDGLLTTRCFLSSLRTALWGGGQPPTAGRCACLLGQLGTRKTRSFFLGVNSPGDILAKRSEMRP